MGILEKLSNIRESEIFKMRYNGKIIGLRVKIFNVNTDAFEYYDFTLDTIKDNDHVRSFIDSIQSTMEVQDLIAKDGLLMTQDEIDGKCKVTEFKDFNNAVSVLAPMKNIYEYKARKKEKMA